MRRWPWEGRTGTSALTSRSAVLVQDASASGGRVRIADEEWSTRSYDGNLVIPACTTVDVIEIGGATASVYPRSKS
jgi:membrane protein implicated in regulation of membrane protease activity